jgi:hypothetical protein
MIIEAATRIKASSTFAEAFKGWDKNLQPSKDKQVLRLQEESAALYQQLAKLRDIKDAIIQPRSNK